MTLQSDEAADGLLPMNVAEQLMVSVTEDITCSRDDAKVYGINCQW